MRNALPIERICSGNVRGNAERFGYSRKAFIVRPKLGRRVKKARGNQMRVSQADASAVKRADFDHLSNFADLRNAYPRQKVQPCKGLHPIAERSQGQFRNDEWMDRNVARLEL